MKYTKGISGNPKGRPKAEDSAAVAIRKAITEKDWKAMANALMAVVLDPNKSGRDKASCYNALADRAFGKPVQKQIVQELPSPPIDDVAIRELQAAIGLDFVESGISNDDSEGV